MAELVRFILLTENEAAIVRGTTSLGHALDPITIQAGPYAGKAVLPLATLTDPSHINARLFLLQAAQANVDPDHINPPGPEGA